ncbi:hypothetical protein Y032_0277g1132 [Ancylostoma ceylanicum]|uniref:Uncharacterized protein n=1 Tax=Ancylostoma ceylanicum TaxID=53326 RepID=A0A016S7E0_9BILA|nr:hypothetical protein Y032_0277g1132 [Ancylostoma ceylanicum]
MAKSVLHPPRTPSVPIYRPQGDGWLGCPRRDRTIDLVYAQRASYHCAILALILKEPTVKPQFAHHSSTANPRFDLSM